MGIALSAGAEPPPTSGRVGLGQDTAAEPAMIRNLRLSDPMVRQKYLNEPDMLRFLRGTYSEACARGMLVQASTQVKLDKVHHYPPAVTEMVTKLLATQRLWKMPSFELESIFGTTYLRTGNYCDCLMKEVSDSDLVNPRKGLEVIDKLSPSVQKSCDSLAAERTEQFVKKN